ncbi:MAG: type II toxin-antitoxin system VapC family toxin [Thermodesulfobacteriota bacterium]
MSYFIDTNIFIYSLGRDHPLKFPCLKVLQSIRDKRICTLLNTEIIQEILYRYQSIRELAIGIKVAKEVIYLAKKILPVTENDLSLALKILESHPQIHIRDAFHAATMINNGIKEIISTDLHFDLISEIKRIDPAHLSV